MSEQLTQISKRFFDEVCNRRHIGAADQLFSANHVYHDPGSPGVGVGPAGMKGLIGAYHRGVNDAQWDVHAMVQAGDLVITRWTGRGTHTGDLIGIPATGRKVQVDGIWMHRIVGGQIVESWNCWDTLGMLEQLGVLLRNGRHEERGMSENPNVALVKKIYGLFTSGDTTGMLHHFAADVTWETPGAPRIPYAGQFRGRNEVAGFLDGLNRTAQFDRFEPREFIAEGDRVVVLGHYSGKGRKTGRSFSTHWAMVFTVQNNKVTKFHEYFDTSNLGGAFS